MASARRYERVVAQYPRAEAREVREADIMKAECRSIGNAALDQGRLGLTRNVGVCY